MQILLVFFFMIAVATAQMAALSEIPSCALQCMIKAIPSTGCNLTDIQCLCTSEALWAGVQSCSMTTCSVKELLTSSRVATNLCQFPVRDRTQVLPIIATTLCAIAFIVLLIRLISRRPGVTGPIGWDDAIVTIAFALAVPIVFFAWFGREQGLGRDIWMIPFNDISNVLRTFYLTQGFYVSSVCLTKVALLLFLLRVFPQNWFRRVCCVMIGIVVLFGIAFCLSCIFQCRPINYIWNQWDGEHEGECLNIYVGSYVNAAINMLLDVAILVMPMPMLIKLHTSYSWKRKFHILIMFSFGAIVTVFSALRVRNLVNFKDLVNPTWSFIDVGIWSISEMFVGIICACLPANKVFFMRLVPQWLGKSVADSEPASSGKKNGKEGSSSRSGNSKWSSKFSGGRDNGRAPRIPTAALTAVSSFHDNRDSKHFEPLSGDPEEGMPLEERKLPVARNTAFGGTVRSQPSYGKSMMARDPSRDTARSAKQWS